MASADAVGKITVTVECAELDDAIEKANRLKRLLGEVSNLISSLGGKPINVTVNTN